MAMVLQLSVFAHGNVQLTGWPLLMQSHCDKHKADTHV